MGQLLKKTSSAVAVDDSLTTIIDWTNIEDFSGFTIIVENTGGGSADNITDIQIDTSDDGGITIALDQHAGVPAVPIASGNSKKGSFTETAKYIRVRGICATDEDTTASCWILADSAAARICTLTDLKDRLGLSEATYDSVLNTIINGIVKVFNNYLNRVLILNSEDATEYYKGEGDYLQVERYPIVSITSIKEAIDFDFDNATALAANTDYRLVKDGRRGIIYRITAKWSSEEDSIKIIYKGGYCAAGVTPGTGETALPSDIIEAAIEQSSFIFKRRDDIGLSSVGVMGGSISKFSDMELLPMVKNILDKYKRHV